MIRQPNKAHALDAGLRRCLIRASLAALLIGFCSRAKAAALLTISDGNPLDTIVVSDNGVGDSINYVGAVYVRTNIGVWNLMISAVVGRHSLFGGSSQPDMDLLIQGNSSAAANLTVAFSDMDFVAPIGTGALTSTADGHTFDGAGSATLTYDVYRDPSNLPYSGGSLPVTLITHMDTAPLPLYAREGGQLLGVSRFSLTQIMSFSAAGPTGFSVDGNFFVETPEPSLLGFCGLGLVAGGLRFSHRRQKQSPQRLGLSTLSLLG